MMSLKSQHADLLNIEEAHEIFGGVDFEGVLSFLLSRHDFKNSIK